MRHMRDTLSAADRTRDRHLDQGVRRHYWRARLERQRTLTVERDHYFDAGATQTVIPGLNVGIDLYYKKATDLIDEGQFGPALIFETFNYAKGRVYGTEFTSSYTYKNLYTYANFAYSVAQGTQVVSGQFNFSPAELKYINSHYIFLYYDQTFTSSVGAVYNWRGYSFSLDGIYGSGLRKGFANTGNLPFYIQLDAGISKWIADGGSRRDSSARGDGQYE